MNNAHNHNGVLNSWRLRSHAMLTLLLAAWLICPIIAAGIISSASEGASSVPQAIATQLPVFYWMVLGACGVGTVVLGWLFIRLCIAPSRVSDHDGEVCPTCISPMKRVANDDAPDALLRCESCTAEFNRLKLRLYWNGFPMPAWYLKQWYFQHARPRSRVQAIWLHLRRFLHDRPTLTTTVAGAAGALPGSFIMIFGPMVTWTLDPVYLFFRLFPPLAFLGSMICFGLSVKYVRELQVLCRKCRYQKHNDIDVSPVCPECGNRWHAIGGMRCVSYRIRSAPFVSACVVLVVSLALANVSLTQNLPQRYASTEALIDVVMNSSEPAWSEWRALQDRELTDAQRTRLIDTALNWHADQSGRHRFASLAWLTAQFNAGEFTEEQLERNLGNYMTVTMEGPDTLVLGQSTDFTLTSAFRGSLVLGALEVHFRGFRINGSEHWHDRADETTPAHLFGRREGMSPYRRQPSQIEPRITITGEVPGEITVIADYWLVARPAQARGQTAAPITWNDDGTPVLPDDALWSSHRRLEHRVLVVEP